jgi:hypothetical protein
MNEFIQKLTSLEEQHEKKIAELKVYLTGMFAHTINFMANFRPKLKKRKIQLFTC